MKALRHLLDFVEFPLPFQLIRVTASCAISPIKRSLSWKRALIMASATPAAYFRDQNIGLDHVVGHFCQQQDNTARTDHLKVAIGELPHHSEPS